MLAIYATITLAALSSVSGAPLVKRIAQNIPESTAKWEQACLAAGGGQQCNPLSIAAFSTLLAAPGPCAQQDAADNMIDLAKQLSNNADMIRLTQIFRQQPRNAPDSLSVLYCQQAPRNQELAGLFQCQFQGVNDNLFTGGVAIGAPGTFPLGRSSALSPPGSCPANPGGKIPDAVQLNTLVNSPGSVSGNTGNNNTPPQAPVNNTPPASSVVVAPAPIATPPPVVAPVVTPPTNPAGGFQQQNAKDAQALNVKFQTLAEGTPCTPGEVACIGGKFAQCPFGTMQISTACPGGTTCLALPLVNKVGTSVTCTTADDAARRFAAAGVTGGSNTPPPQAPVNNTPPASSVVVAPAPIATPPPVVAPVVTPPANPAGGFQQQNAKDAQALNVKFQTLAEGAPCTPGEVACIGGKFAQCPSGTMQISTACAGGTTCLALPLVNKAGTSVTCTTTDDAARRFAAAGVTGGFNGSQ